MVKIDSFKGGHKSHRSCRTIKRMNKHCHELLHFSKRYLKAAIYQLAKQQVLPART